MVFLYAKKGAFIPSICPEQGIKTVLCSGYDTTLKNKAKRKEKDMDFLKEILGDELFKQFKEKVDAFNGDEANKEKQIKLANLTSGEYVGKGKYDALQESLTGKDTELANANKLIEDLKKASKGNEDMQSKFTQYEQENAQLQKELAETKVKSALKVALLGAKAVDVDYLTFKLNEKLKEKNESIELDENENIKGWDDKLSGLKTQFPNMFEAAANNKDGYSRLDNGRLPGNDGSNGITKEQFQKMGYQDRVKLFNENPDAYHELTK